MPARERRILLLLFFLSGFSGLVYESVWTHFLKLFLGYAAGAQAAVLALFMGGMAIGAFGSARLSRRWSNPLRAYAIVEGAIGLGAFLFPPAFGALVSFSFASVIPAVDSPVLASAWKWALSGILLLPQSILLGATFHLMAAGFVRRADGQTGRPIALLYFLNSLGASAGALVSGFVLVARVGLPGTVYIAGAINLVVSAGAFMVSRNPADSSGPGPAVPSREGGGAAPRLEPFLLVAMLTGAASFLYEVGWIRMLSLVLGSSTHAFEIMLSAFIIGLALGAWWISGRMDRLRSPALALGVAQVAMGAAAAATMPLYGLTFDLMKAGLDRIEPTPAGFLLFNLMSHGIAMLLMLPATFCAGAVLPLVTQSMLRKGRGEGCIGAAYSWNTVGAMAGVLFGVHAGFPLLGLQGIVGLGAAIDLSVGGWLLYRLRREIALPPGRLAAAAGLASAIFLAVLLGSRFDVLKMASGVYRKGELMTAEDSRILFHKDGKTATISVTSHGDAVRSIRTNGKADASVRIDGTRGIDEATMTLLGAIPVALHPGARRVANIGFGSGLTTHTLLLFPSIESVDTVEIEPEVPRAARWFGPRVELAFTDPRSAIHIDDARNFLSSGNRRYDLIVSEPSNPWMSGVSGLFTDEFYRIVRRRLAEGGLLAQWMHLYDLDFELVVSVLKAVSGNFDQYTVYATNDFDILVVARNGAPIPSPDPAILGVPAVSRALGDISIRGPQDLELRRIGDRSTLSRLIESASVPVNSDYMPVLDQGAWRARFLGASSPVFATYAREPLPALELLSGRPRATGTTSVTPSADFKLTGMVGYATAFRDRFTGRAGPLTGEYPPQLADDVRIVRAAFSGTAGGEEPVRRLIALYNVGTMMTCFLTVEELDAVWASLEAGGGGVDRLKPSERGFVSFLKAVGARDGRAMAALASRLVGEGEIRDPVPYEYLVVGGGLGAYVSGDRAALDRFRPLLEDDGIVQGESLRLLRDTMIGRTPSG